jgi:hypothetical protein
VPSRYLSETILRSVKLNAISLGAEVLYRRIFSVADDFGRFYATPVTIRCACWPTCPNKVTDEQVAAWIAELAANGLARPYSADGCEYLELAEFGQRTPRSSPKFPDPPQYASRPTPDRSQPSNNPLADRKQDAGNMPAEGLQSANPLRYSKTYSSSNTSSFFDKERGSEMPPASLPLSTTNGTHPDPGAEEHIPDFKPRRRNGHAADTIALDTAATTFTVAPDANCELCCDTGWKHFEDASGNEGAVRCPAGCPVPAHELPPAAAEPKAKT